MFPFDRGGLSLSIKVIARSWVQALTTNFCLPFLPTGSNPSVPLWEVVDTCGDQVRNRTEGYEHPNELRVVSYRNGETE